jgi:hypothetical protein
MYIKAGMRVVCPNGHHIATAKVDMPPYNVISVDYFDWKFSKHPKAGDTIASAICPVCQLPYFSSGKVRFLIDGHGYLPKGEGKQDGEET